MQNPVSAVGSLWAVGEVGLVAPTRQDWTGLDWKLSFEFIEQQADTLATHTVMIDDPVGERSTIVEECKRGERKLFGEDSTPFAWRIPERGNNSKLI